MFPHENRVSSQEEGEEDLLLPPPDAAHEEQDWVSMSESEENKEKVQVKKSWGCAHYKRKCKLVAPCCGEEFWCRHCHNDIKSTNEKDIQLVHEMDRMAVRQIICMACGTYQPPAANCRDCTIQFAKYFCHICNFWDDNAALNNKVFHCDACGICRVGGRENFFHCQKCQSCYSNSLKERHVCIEGAMKNPCPICFEDMFSSTKTVTVLTRCGHTMHQECQRILANTPAVGLQALRCPICGKGMYENEEIWRRIEREIQANPLPPNIQKKVRISCNDCGNRSVAPWHPIGMQCKKCKSFNTVEIGVAPSPEGAGDDVQEGEEDPPAEQPEDNNHRPAEPPQQQAEDQEIGDIEEEDLWVDEEE